MFDKFSPPTDNLYKFTAIIGLLMIMLPLAVLPLWLYGLDEKLNSIYDQFLTEQYETNKGQTLIVNSHGITSTLANLLANNKLEQYHSNYIYWKYAFYINPFIMGLGIILAVRGFRLWYDKTQKFNDELLAAEVYAMRQRIIDNKLKK